MKVNLHTNFYNINSIYKNKPAFKGKDGNNKNDFGSNQLIAVNTKKDDDIDTFYNEVYDDGYNKGYKDGSKFSKFGFFLLSALSILNLYGTKLSIDNSNTNSANLTYEIAESNYNLNQRLDELQLDVNSNDTILLETILDLMFKLEALQKQQNQLKEQIKALPENSEEAQSLKEELRSIEEQYEILEEKYKEYILEQHNKNEDTNNQNNEHQEDTPDETPLKNEQIFMV